MLERALHSCSEIEPHADYGLEFIVVENGSGDLATSVVQKFENTLEIKIVSEPNLGIVSARNAGIEAFLDSQAHWMASFDDDVIVSAGWLQAVASVIGAYPACNIFAGPQHRIAGAKAGRWLPHRPFPEMATGTVTWNVSTANVIFRRYVFAAEGLGLRFDPEFNFSGGEDTRLFYMLKDMDESIRWAKDALVTEPTADVRATFKARAARYSLQAHNWGRLNILRFAGGMGRILVFWFMFASAMNFVTYGLIGMFALVYSEQLGIKIYNKSLINGCEAIGYFKALFLKPSRFYSSTDGC